MNFDNPTLWPAGTAVRMVKLAAVDDPQHQTCSWDKWKPGQQNDGSPPVDYELRGHLIAPLEIGKPIIVARTHRNGVQVLGTFVSTPVREFKNGAAITMNSIYFISRDEQGSDV
jgi:hypothetical protein